MKARYLLLACLFMACNGNVRETGSHVSGSGADTSAVPKGEESTLTPPETTNANEAFREVTIQKVGAHRYNVKGEARVFEGTVSWVVEDGHNELLKGFETTDAGAPAWGHFAFTVEVQRQEPNSTLTLVLFESSAKDGSRVHELPMPLERSSVEHSAN